MSEGSKMLKLAHDTVVERGKVYGNAKENMERTAGLWSGIMGKEVTGAQVALCMAQVKFARLIETPDHKDSVVDVMGYMAVYWDCVEEGETE